MPDARTIITTRIHLCAQYFKFLVYIKLVRLNLHGVSFSAGIQNMRLRGDNLLAPHVQPNQYIPIIAQSHAWMSWPIDESLLPELHATC